MKKAVLLIVFNSVLFYAQTQNIIPKWIFSDKSTKIFDVTPVWSQEDDMAYIFYTESFGRSKTHFIKTENKGNTLTSFELIHNKKSREIIDIVESNNKFIITSQLKDPRKKRRMLFLETFDKTSLKPDNNYITVAEEDFDPYSSYSTQNPDNIDHSPNKHFFTFWTKDDVKSKKIESPKFYVSTYNTKLEKLYKTPIIDLNKKNKDVLLESAVDNEGNCAFLLARTPDYKLKNPKFLKFYEVVYISNKTQGVFRYTVPEDEITLLSGLLSFNKHGQLFLNYTYSKTNQGEGILTCIFEKESFELLDQTFQDFQSDIMHSRGLDLTVKEKGKKIPFISPSEHPYYLLDVVFKSEGGYFLTAYEFYEVAVTSTNSRTGRTSVRYYPYYEDLLIFDFNNKRELVDIASIDRLSSLSSDGGNTYMHLKDDKMFFLYLTTEGTKNKYGLNSINFNGKNEKLAESKDLYDERGIMDVSKCLQIDENHSLIYFQDKSQHSVGILEY